MSEAMKIAAEPRDRAGKGASRALRREGRVPAVIYGDKKDALGIHVEERALAKLLSTGHMLSSVVEVDVGGTTHRTLPKDVQFHPVSERPIHVDFMRLARGMKIEVEVPMHFTDHEASPGLKRGGVLNIVRHEIGVTCRPSLIPDELSASLKGLQIGDSIHVSQIALPEGVEVDWGEQDYTVATIVAPSALKSQEDEAAATEAPTADAVPTTAQEEDAEVPQEEMGGRKGGTE